MCASLHTSGSPQSHSSPSSMYPLPHFCPPKSILTSGILYKHMPTPFSRLATRSFLLHVLNTVGNGYLFTKRKRKGKRRLTELIFFCIFFYYFVPITLLILYLIYFALHFFICYHLLFMYILYFLFVLLFCSNLYLNAFCFLFLSPSGFFIYLYGIFLYFFSFIIICLINYILYC